MCDLHRKILEEVREARRENEKFFQELNLQLNKILHRLPDNVLSGFNINERLLSGETKMSEVLKAAVDLAILDDGKGVLYTLTPVNVAKQPVPLPPGVIVTPASSAPASLVVAPDPGDPTANPPRPADTSGLVFLGTVPQPPVDATGVVASFSATLPNNVVISASADPVDVVADSSPAGFSISETAE